MRRSSLLMIAKVATCLRCPSVEATTTAASASPSLPETEATNAASLTSLPEMVTRASLRCHDMEEMTARHNAEETIASYLSLLETLEVTTCLSLPSLGMAETTICPSRSLDMVETMAACLKIAMTCLLGVEETARLLPFLPSHDTEATTTCLPSLPEMETTCPSLLDMEVMIACLPFLPEMAPSLPSLLDTVMTACLPSLLEMATMTTCPFLLSLLGVEVMIACLPLSIPEVATTARPGAVAMTTTACLSPFLPAVATTTACLSLPSPATEAMTASSLSLPAIMAMTCLSLLAEETTACLPSEVTASNGAAEVTTTTACPRSLPAVVPNTEAIAAPLSLPAMATASPGAEVTTTTACPLSLLVMAMTTTACLLSLVGAATATTLSLLAAATTTRTLSLAGDVATTACPPSLLLEVATTTACPPSLLAVAMKILSLAGAEVATMTACVPSLPAATTTTTTAGPFLVGRTTLPPSLLEVATTACLLLPGVVKAASIAMRARE